MGSGSRCIQAAATGQLRSGIWEQDNLQQPLKWTTVMTALTCTDPASPDPALDSACGFGACALALQIHPPLTYPPFLQVCHQRSCRCSHHLTIEPTMPTDSLSLRIASESFYPLTMDPSVFNLSTNS